MNLADNKITDVGGEKLCMQLIMNNTMQTIDLRHNNLGEKTAKAFRLVSLKNKMLTKVHLEYNLINLKHIEEIATMTAANVSKQDRHKHQIVARECKNQRRETEKFFRSVYDSPTGDKDDVYRELEERLMV